MTPAPANDPLVAAATEALRAVVDPEVGVNVVDLGLVYRVAREGGSLAVDLTMTSAACPMGEMIVAEAGEALAKVMPPGMRARIALVWDPPWTPELMSEKAKSALGWEG